MDISDHNPVLVMIPKNKVLVASRLPRDKLKQDFSKVSEFNFLDSLTKGLDKSNLGNNLSDPDTKFKKILNIFLNVSRLMVQNNNFLERKSNFILNHGKSIQKV